MKKDIKKKILFVNYLGQAVHQVEGHWVENNVKVLGPCDLLDAIWEQYKNDGKETSSITYCTNTYKYVIEQGAIEQGEEEQGGKKYRIHIHIEDIKDDWNKMITFFNDFEIIFNSKDCFATFYPIGDGIEQYIYETIEKQLLNHEFEKLAAYRSKHFNDFLAMMLIQNIVKMSKIQHRYSYPHLTVEPITRIIKLADSDNMEHQILYAFNKKDADALVVEFAPSGEDEKYDKFLQQNKRHIVYFVNTDFENFGHKKIENENAESISIKALMLMLRVPLKEWIKYELAILYLTYNHNQEHLDWINPYAISYLRTRIEENAIKTKDFEPISESLFQDALNTLSTSKHLSYYLDYFLFVCAANLANRKFRDIMEPLKKKSKEEFFVQKKKVDGFKKHIFDIFKSWMKERPKGIYICLGRIYENGVLSDDITVFVNMKVDNRCFQFRFRMKGEGYKEKEYMKELVTFAKENGIRVNGEDSGIYLQPIAQTLYQYAYLLKLGMK